MVQMLDFLGLVLGAKAVVAVESTSESDDIAVETE